VSTPYNPIQVVDTNKMNQAETEKVTAEYAATGNVSPQYVEDSMAMKAYFSFILTPF